MALPFINLVKSFRTTFPGKCWFSLLFSASISPFIKFIINTYVQRIEKFFIGIPLTASFNRYFQNQLHPLILISVLGFIAYMKYMFNLPLPLTSFGSIKMVCELVTNEFIIASDYSCTYGSGQNLSSHQFRLKERYG